MKKIFLGSIAVIAIAAISAWNVNVNSNGLSDVSLANYEALAGNENSGSGGWTEEKSETTFEVNDVPKYHRIVIDCTEGGSNSCTKSCRIQYYEGGKWNDWEDC